MIKRMFTTASVKGKKDYINSQKKYEIIRTVLYFFISFSLFIAGYIATQKRENLLTVVAVVGCLPACKSLVNAIMFLRYKSCPKEASSMIEQHIGGLHGLYDMIFTSEKKTFVIFHMTIHGNMLCCYTATTDFPEKDFQLHMERILKTEGYKNYSIKVFRDLTKYTERLDQLNSLETEDKHVCAVSDILKSVVL